MAKRNKTTQSSSANTRIKNPAPRRNGKVTDGVLRTNDVSAEQGLAANGLAAAMPFNATKKLEYGHTNAVSPAVGAIVKPDDAGVTASTNSEANQSAKTGGAATPGTNATTASLDRVRADAGGQALTTNQGVPISDNKSSLKAGLR